MSVPDSHKGFLRAIPVFFGWLVLLASVSILGLLLIPADPKNAWIGGYSPARWVMIVFALGIGIVSAVLAYKTWRDADFNARISNSLMKLATGRLLYFSWVILGFTTLFVLPNLYLYSYINLYPFFGVVFRLLLIVSFGLALVSIFLIFLTILYFQAALQPEEGIERPWAGNITPFSIFLILTTIIFFLVFANGWSYWVNQAVSPINKLPLVQSYFRLFNLDREFNLPSGFATIQLLISAFLLGFIAANKKQRSDPYLGFWVVLFLIFLYLAADEWFVLHELWSDPMESFFQPTGLLGFFPWLIIGIPLVLVFSLVFFKFFLHLPGKIKAWMALAAVVYVIGAIGLELAGGWSVIAFGFERNARFLLYSFEESVEMLGIAIFIFTLWSYLKMSKGDVSIDHKENTG